MDRPLAVENRIGTTAVSPLQPQANDVLSFRFEELPILANKTYGCGCCRSFCSRCSALTSKAGGGAFSNYLIAPWAQRTSSIGGRALSYYSARTENFHSMFGSCESPPEWGCPGVHRELVYGYMGRTQKLLLPVLLLRWVDWLGFNLMFASFDSMMAFLISFVFRVPFFFCLAFLISFVFRCIKSHISWCRDGSHRKRDTEAHQPYTWFMVWWGKKSGYGASFMVPFFTLRNKNQRGTEHLFWSTKSWKTIELPLFDLKESALASVQILWEKARSEEVYAQ